MLADFLISQSGDLWERYVEHPFVVQLGKGTLAPEAFTHFLRQGYLYLLHYARVYALAAYKAKNFEEIAASMTVVQNCINEVKINVQVSSACFPKSRIGIVLLNAFCSSAKAKASRKRCWKRQKRAMRVLLIVAISWM